MIRDYDNYNIEGAFLWENSNPDSGYQKRILDFAFLYLNPKMD